MSASAVLGFATMAGLIPAIGAQNAFVLECGVMRRHHVWVALVCAASDALLVGIGLAGLGAVLAGSGSLSRGMAGLGALFLAWYGGRALASALRGTSALQTRAQRSGSLRASLLFTLAVTYLNPHVYLDTVLLIGGIGGRLPPAERILFWAGAVSASCLWFLGLSLGGRSLAPILRRPTAWRMVEFAVGACMWTVALGLARNALWPQA